MDKAKTEDEKEHLQSELLALKAKLGIGNRGEYSRIKNCVVCNAEYPISKSQVCSKQCDLARGAAQAQKSRDKKRAKLPAEQESASLKQRVNNAESAIVIFTRERRPDGTVLEQELIRPLTKEHNFKREVQKSVGLFLEQYAN